MPEPQAAAIVRVLADADVGQLATKSDLADLRADMRTEIAGVRTEVEVVRGDFKVLNGKVNLLLAFNTSLVLAVLALLWRAFSAGTD